MNCGSTRLFGVPQGVNVYGTYEVMLGEEIPQDVVIRPGDMDTVNLPKNVHLIAAHTKLEGIESALTNKQGPFASSNDSLRQPIESLRGQYDYIFLDTSPSMTPPTKAAYMVSQYFVLTAVPERLAIEGLVNAIQYIKHAARQRQHRPAPDGGRDEQRAGKGRHGWPPPSSKKWTSTSRRATISMRRYETSISASTIVPTVQQGGKTLFEEAPDHKVTQQYRQLADEFEARFAGLHAPDTDTASATETGPTDGVTTVQINPDLEVPQPAPVAEGVVNG